MHCVKCATDGELAALGGAIWNTASVLDVINNTNTGKQVILNLGMCMVWKGVVI